MVASPSEAVTRSVRILSGWLFVEGRAAACFVFGSVCVGLVEESCGRASWSLGGALYGSIVRARL